MCVCWSRARICGSSPSGGDTLMATSLPPEVDLFGQVDAGERASPQFLDDPKAGELIAGERKRAPGAPTSRPVAGMDGIAPLAITNGGQAL